MGEKPPERRSVEQLRGIEGVRVRKLCQVLAKRHGVERKRRNYNPEEWGSGDLPNRCVSAAIACLYGITEAAVDSMAARVNDAVRSTCIPYNDGMED